MNLCPFLNAECNKTCMFAAETNDYYCLIKKHIMINDGIASKLDAVQKSLKGLASDVANMKN